MERCYFNFLCPLWGERYIDQYFELVMPTLLAPGNLPAIAREEKPTFTFLTRTSERKVFRHNSEFKRLCEYANTRFVFIDGILRYVGRYRGGRDHCSSTITPRETRTYGPQLHFER